MAILSVTNTFTDNTVCFAVDHNANFSDIQNYINNRNSASLDWEMASIVSGAMVPLSVDNLGGTQSLFQGKDNGSVVYEIFKTGIISIPNQSGFRAYKNSGVQTIAVSTTNKITFDAETYDIQSEYDTATSKFTCSKSGKYLVTASILSSVNKSPGIRIHLYVNGSLYSTSGFFRQNTSPLYYLGMCFFDIVNLVAGDYIEIYVTSDSVFSCEITTGASKTFFAVHKIA